MAELARPERPARCDYSYRLVAPLFDGQGLIVSATADADAVRLTTRDAASRTTATGVIRPTARRRQIPSRRPPGTGTGRSRSTRSCFSGSPR